MNELAKLLYLVFVSFIFLTALMMKQTTKPRLSSLSSISNEIIFKKASFIKGSRAELQRHLAERNVEHIIMVQSKMDEKQFDIDMMQGANTQMQQQQQILEKQVANER